ncbi:MAG: major capsid protein P2 [Rickettsiales bacterium]|nr:major capsid protein P2 [Rickettsiales bacterium]
MALHPEVKLSPFTPPQAGEITTLDVQLGRTYRDILIKYTESGTLVTEANMILAIEEVNIKVNGKSVRRETAESIIMRQKLHKIPYVDGFLKLEFAEEWAEAIFGQETPAFGTNNVQSLQIDVKIATGRTAPAISATAQVTVEAQPRNLGLIKKVTKHIVPVAQVGTHNLTTLPRLENIVAIHCKSGDIDSFKVLAEGYEAQELTVEENDARIELTGDLAPQSGWVSIMFNKTNRIDDYLPVYKQRAGGNKGELQNIASLQIDFEMSAATPFPIFVETLSRSV